MYSKELIKNISEVHKLIVTIINNSSGGLDNNDLNVFNVIESTLNEMKVKIES